MEEDTGSMLGVSAARQIVSKMNTSEREQLEMVAKLERSCKKLDHGNRGSLTINEYWNICRVQNRINVSKDEVREIMIDLPHDDDGRIKIADFVERSIYSPEVFDAKDRNNDGFISKGELKVANKQSDMGDIERVISKFDLNQDGTLEYGEFRAASNWQIQKDGTYKKKEG